MMKRLFFALIATIVLLAGMPVAAQHLQPSLTLRGLNSDPKAVKSSAVLYFNKSTNKLRASMDGGAFADFGAGGGLAGAYATQQVITSTMNDPATYNAVTGASVKIVNTTDTDGNTGVGGLYVETNDYGTSIMSVANGMSGVGVEAETSGNNGIAGRFTATGSNGRGLVVAAAQGQAASFSGNDPDSTNEVVVTVSGGGLLLQSSTSGATRPTCYNGIRGLLWYQTNAGSADTLAVCAKDSGGAHAWRTIY